MKHMIWCDWELMKAAMRRPLVERILAEYPCLTLRDAEYMAADLNANAIYDELERMRKTLPADIICIATLCNERGKFYGYRDLGNDLADVFKILSGTPLAALMVNSKGELLGCGIGKDVHNEYNFRIWREGVSDKAKAKLRDKLIGNRATKDDINRCTIRLGDIVGDIYGFAFPGRRPIN